MTDRFVVRLVVAFLGTIVVVGLALGGYLAAVGKSVPDFVISTAAAALGGLTGILVKTSSEPMPVVPTPGQPMQVEPAEHGQSLLYVLLVVILVIVLLRLL